MASSFDYACADETNHPFHVDMEVGKEAGKEAGSSEGMMFAV
jgi:hypothetical protein